MAKEQIKMNKMVSLFENIFTAKEFKAIIINERNRSDRNGSCFSIIYFDVAQKDQKALKTMYNTISHTDRSIDCIGWYEDKCIAILLPDTNKDGALVFRKKLLDELNLINEKIYVKIYSYPEQWLSNNSTSLTQKIGKNTECIEQLFIKKMPSWKRYLDIFGSLVLLTITMPIFILLSLFIKIMSPGPVFFKQIRIGYKGFPFTFWKFRTMKYDNNQSFHGKHSQSFIKNGDVPMEKLDNRDPRIITGGRVIRKSCIDELPQLWNILRGDMSLVGPRPCIPYEADEYLRWHTHRFDSIPGLSGLWQVSGKNKLTFKQMIRLDIKYSNNMSLWGDLYIIFKTPFAIVKMIWEAVAKRVTGKNEETIL